MTNLVPPLALPAAILQQRPAAMQGGMAGAALRQARQCAGEGGSALRWAVRAGGGAGAVPLCCSLCQRYYVRSRAVKCMLCTPLGCFLTAAAGQELRRGAGGAGDQGKCAIACGWRSTDGPLLTLLFAVRPVQVRALTTPPPSRRPARRTAVYCRWRRTAGSRPSRTTMRRAARSAPLR